MASLMTSRNLSRMAVRLITICLLLAAGLTRSDQGETLTVSVEGLEGELRDNVEVYLEIFKLSGQAAPSESRLRYLFARGKEEIRRALAPFGYYRPEIDATLEHTAGAWQARYKIDRGPALRIASVDVRVLGEGAKDSAFEQVLNKLPLAEGQVLYQPRYEDLKRTLQGIAAERGYFDARLLENEIRVDLQSYSAAIVLHFDTGKRYRFGQVSFQQNFLAPAFLNRYPDFKPGDPYQAGKLLKLQSDLINSQYFKQVEVDAPPDKAHDQTIPVDVLAEPAPASKYSFGLGYGTDTGVRGKLGVEWPRINRWGHHYKAELLASQIKSSLTSEYIIPGADPRTDQYSGRLGYLYEKSDIQDSRTALVGVSKKKQDGLWLKILSLDYQRETFTFGDLRQTTGLLIPSANWTRIKVDNRLDVSEGSMLNLKLSGAYEPLLSDVSFVQASVHGKWITSIGASGRLILRGDLGTTVTSSFQRLPSSLRFFAGGDTSVRGYKLDGIGPTDSAGNVIGGKHLLVGSVEYDHEIRKNWSLALFVDSGDAFDGPTPQMKTGVGAGVRWQSPVGPVRLDLASGLDRPPGSVIRLHVNLGPDL